MLAQELALTMHVTGIWLKAEGDSMDDLTHIRSLIFSEASESEKVELRKKWLTEPQVNGTTRRGGTTKGNEMNASSFFTEMIDEEIESNDEAAQQAGEQKRSKLAKANERELAKQFAKLIDGNVARVLNGELVFQLPNSSDFYAVTMDNGNFMLNINGAEVEKFSGNGDAIRSLAKILAKNPQP